MTAITLVLVTKHRTLGGILSSAPCLFALLSPSWYCFGISVLPRTAAAVTAWPSTQQGVRDKEHQWPLTKDANAVFLIPHLSQ